MENKKKNLVWMIVAGLVFIVVVVISLLPKNDKKPSDSISFGDIDILSNNSVGDAGLEPENRTEEEIEYDEARPTVMLSDENNTLKECFNNDIIPIFKKPELICGIAITYKDNGCDNVSTVVVEDESVKYEDSRVYVIVHDKDNTDSRVSCCYDLPRATFYYKYMNTDVSVE